MADKISIPIESKYDDKGAKQALKDAKELDKLKPKLTVEADTQKATRDIEGLLKKADKLGADPATILLTSNATDIAVEITDLISDLDKLDANDPQVDVKASQINDLKGDLDAVEGKIREVNNVPVDIDTKPAQEGVRKVGEEGDKSRSVLANMVGNSAQDLGQLGGVAGSAGVAVGQIAEYATEGDIALSGLASTVVPMAALGFAVQALASHMADVAATKAFNSERVEHFKSALDDAKLTAQELVGILSKDKDTGIFERWRNDTVNVDKDVAHFFKTFTDFKKVTDEGMPGFDKWAQQQLDAKKASGASSIEMYHLKQALDDVRDGSITGTSATNAMAEGNEGLMKTALALTNVITGTAESTRNAGWDTKFYGDALQDTTTATEDQTTALQGSAGAYIRQQAGIAGWTASQEAATAAADEFNKTVASTDFGGARLQGGLTGMKQFHDVFFALPEIASANEEAFDNLGKSLKDNGHNWDLNTEKGRANQTALEDVASTIDLQLADAFNKAKGNFKTFQTSAQNISNTLSTRLQKELGLSKDDADAMIRKLGLMPKDIETRYKMSGTEEARVKIGLLQTSIDNLPKDVQAKVTQQIIKGDYVGAVNTVQNYFTNHPPSMKTNVVPPYNSDLANAVGFATSFFTNNPAHMRVVVSPPVEPFLDRGGHVGPDGAIAAELRPEFARLPGGSETLLTQPTYVPPGTQVTSGSETARILAAGPSTSNITVNMRLPTGWRGDPLAEVHRTSRRAGRFYQRVGR
jgi:hypothetical protein